MRPGGTILLLGLILALAACGGGAATPSPELRFIALGDQGTGGTDQKAVAAAIKAKIDASGCDFIMLLGDNFYPSGVSSIADAQWTTAYEEVYGVLRLPVYAVLGNHDYGGGGGTVDSIGAIETAYVGASNTWHMPASWYRWQQGPATLIATDTNWIKMHADDLGQSLDVAAWLDDAGTGWKIVFGHHPWVSNGAHGNAGSYDGQDASAAAELNGSRLQTFFDGVVQGRADLYLCGHDHDLEVFEKAGNATLNVVSGGGGGGLYDLALTNPRAETLFEAKSFGFAYVLVQDAGLTLEIYDSTATRLYSITRTKS